MDGSTEYRNTVSGDAVVHGPVLQAARIERIDTITFQAPTGPPPPPPSQLPAPHKGFVDRDRERALLSAVLNSAEPGGPEVVVVTGLGGVGKSQLVVHWARQHADEHFPGGRLYADLGEVRRDGAVDPGAVLAGFLRSMHVPADRIPASLAARAALFRSETAGRPVLVVVDDAQHAAEVRPLLPSDGLVVVTSRRKLAALELDGAIPLQVEPLDDEAGLRLVRRWRAAADEDSAAELLRLCGGLPLFMRAAGGWLIERPDLELADVVRLLAGSREQALSDVLTSVVHELPEHTRQLYTLLGCLPGATFSAASAGAAGAVRFDEALRDLLGAHLAAPASRPGHFALHPLVREHAAVLAERDPSVDRRAVLRRLADFYTEQAATADQLAVGPGFRLHAGPQQPPQPVLFTTSAQAVAWLDAERGNLMAVLRAATDEGRHGTVWRLCDRLWGMFHTLKPYADWIEAHQLAVRAAQWEGRVDVEASMRNRLGRGYLDQGELSLAEEQVERAEVVLRDATGLDGRLTGMLRETAGLIALARCSAATGRARAAHDPAGLGAAAVAGAQAEAAVRLFALARDDNAAEHDAHGVVVQTYNLAQALVAAGRPADALAALDEAERTAEATADHGMRSRIGLVRGLAHRAAGQPAPALDAFTVAAQWAGRQNQKAKADQILALVAELAAECGEPTLREAAERKAAELRGAPAAGHP